ncbi:class I SAM-dependent methyltransferase [archaeon]|nr:MAG: class I SAM-dependent methyltransferase [archaeon]
MYIKNCRVCKGTDLHKFLDFGLQPAADAFVTKEQLNEEEPKFPLEVWFCKTCGHMQLGYIAAREPLYRSFRYLSSVSMTMKRNFENIASYIVTNFGLGKDSLVVDIGCNDGSLLRAFRALGTRVLGVDPSPTVEFAIADGIDVVKNFFSEDVGQMISEKYGKVSAVTGTNVFAHIEDYDTFLNGMNRMLTDDGILMFEFPYLVDTLKEFEFDTIYHEHLSYFSIRPLVVLFKRFNMEIFDVKRTPMHGGSIRIFVKKNIGKWKKTNAVDELLKLEKEMKLDELETYVEFARNVNKVRENLVSLLTRLKSEGKRIVGNGAAAKGNALLNYCGIGKETIDYLAEMNKLKQGSYNPGMHIPVVSMEQMHADNPDYMIILPWNIKDDIMRQEQEFKKRGGKFIIPIPTPVIV